MLLITQATFINLCFISKRLIQACYIKSSIKKIWQLNFLSKKLIHVKEKVRLPFTLFKKFLRQCRKTIHWGTHCNKIKKPCWKQLSISKCCKVAGTVGVLRLSSFTKKDVSGLKQKKWTALLNSSYSN